MQALQHFKPLLKKIRTVFDLIYWLATLVKDTSNAVSGILTTLINDDADFNRKSRED